MGWLHTHNWQVVAKVYAPPQKFTLQLTRMSDDICEHYINAYNLALHGQTTIVLRCQDKECGETRTEEMFGALVELEKT